MKKIAIVGAGNIGTTIITEAIKIAEHEAVFLEEVKTNPAFEAEPITITARPKLAEIDPRIFLNENRSKYIPNRKKK